ncbi:hypothetical protein FHS68_000066 [Dyadobacter arcticus]|uniref:Uncharacterized protein n=1 Tax=Dyadobacter arcticus TaxID=1078754 RepID=A0ABX0UH58_9BACT|nr:hypothetical protein [Dyadobacter arcticus]
MSTKKIVHASSTYDFFRNKKLIFVKMLINNVLTQKIRKH